MEDQLLGLERRQARAERDLRNFTRDTTEAGQGIWDARSNSRTPTGASTPEGDMAFPDFCTMIQFVMTWNDSYYG